jgi:hypothetical protein
MLIAAQLRSDVGLPGSNTLKMGALCTSETLVPIHKFTGHYNSEETTPTSSLP